MLRYYDTWDRHGLSKYTVQVDDEALIAVAEELDRLDEVILYFLEVGNKADSPKPLQGE